MDKQGLLKRLVWIDMQMQAIEDKRSAHRRRFGKDEKCARCAQFRKELSALAYERDYIAGKLEGA